MNILDTTVQAPLDYTPSKSYQGTEGSGYGGGRGQKGGMYHCIDMYYIHKRVDCARLVFSHLAND